MASSCRFGFVGLMLSLVVGCDSDNRAPQAVDDAATTTAGQAVTVQVLQNDDGSELLIITASTDGANGTTQISADRRSVTYTPNANFFGLGILNEQLEEALAQGDAVVDSGALP